MKKKFLALVMTLSMVLSLVPMTALATGDQSAAEPTQGTQVEQQQQAEEAGTQGEVKGQQTQNAGGNVDKTGGSTDTSQDASGSNEDANTSNGASTSTTTNGEGGSTTGDSNSGDNSGESNDNGTSDQATTVTTEEELREALTKGGIVTLGNDIELTAQIQITSDVTLDLAGKNVLVKIESSEEKTISAFIIGNSQDSKPTVTIQNGGIIGIPENDSRAIECNKGSTISLQKVNIGDFNAKTGNGGAILINAGTLNADECGLGFYKKDSEKHAYGNKAINGGAVYADNANVKIINSTVYYNKSVNRDTTDGVNGGGGLYLYGRQTSALIQKSKFFNNWAYSHGGDIHFDTLGNAKVEGCSLKQSYAEYGNGGSIYSRISEDIDLIDNTIVGNDATRGCGGGIAILGDSNSKVHLDKNKVNSNNAQKRDGGIYLRMLKNSLLTIESGEICDNTAYQFGAGLDYSAIDMEPLRLTNVLITENQAARGAGIWGCPSSETDINSTLGGAIYNNTATGKASSVGYPDLLASGDDIRYEGKDTPDTLAIGITHSASETTKMLVMQRVMGGGLMSWYKDEADSRYNEENPVKVSEDIYTGTNLSFGAHGELSDTSKELALEQAKLIIKGNKIVWGTTVKGRGGGIATNSPVIIGLENSDITVNVEKQWPEEVTLPDQIEIDLYRVNKNDTKKDQVKLDSDVVLNEENNWSTTFTDLPAKYVDSNGQVQDCTYLVKEKDADNWYCSSETIKKGNNTYTIQLANRPAGNLEVSKTVTGRGSTTQEFTFTVTLSDKEVDGTFGNMTFSSGVATFTLKHGESMTAKGLPAGATYTVTESNNDGYTVTKTGDTGSIKAKETVQASFTNHKSGGGSSGGGPITIPDDVPTGLDLKNHYGYIIGYPVDYYTGKPTTDQTKKPVRPEGKITRAEVATIYFRMLTDENRAANWNQVSGFSDVKSSAWYNNAISTLTKAGILKGYEDGTFQPNGYITRAEFATIAIRFFSGVYEGEDLFPDIKGHWAEDYINNAANKGLVKGYEDGTFGPDRYITRAEAVTLVNRTLNRHPHNDGLHKDMLVWPDNMDTSKWYYADMQEATNSHEPDKNKSTADKEYWGKMLPIRDWEALEKEWSNANSAPGEGEVV